MPRNTHAFALILRASDGEKADDRPIGIFSSRRAAQGASDRIKPELEKALDRFSAARMNWIDALNARDGSKEKQDAYERARLRIEKHGKRKIALSLPVARVSYEELYYAAWWSLRVEAVPIILLSQFQ